jgi:hypothetical protein
MELAVAEEDEVGPEFDAEGTAEGPAWGVLDFDVTDLGMGGEGEGDFWGEGLAVRAPGGAEFEEKKALGLVDPVAGGLLGGFVGTGHDRCSCVRAARDWRVAGWFELAGYCRRF